MIPMKCRPLYELRDIFSEKSFIIWPYSLKNPEYRLIMRFLDQSQYDFTKDLWDDYLQKLTLLNEMALDSIQQHRGLFLEIPLDDADTFKAICRGEIELILFSSEIAHWLLRQLQPKCFKELLIALAYNRPTTFHYHLSAFHTLVQRKNGQAPVIYHDPLIEPILADTYGFPLFTEQASDLILALPITRWKRPVNCFKNSSAGSPSCLKSESISCFPPCGRALKETSPGKSFPYWPSSRPKPFPARLPRAICCPANPLPGRIPASQNQGGRQWQGKVLSVPTIPSS